MVPENITKETHHELLETLHTVLVDVRFQISPIHSDFYSRSVFDSDLSEFENYLRVPHACQIHVQEGALVCRKCSRQYPITQGIPNMLLNEHEV